MPKTAAHLATVWPVDSPAWALAAWLDANLLRMEPNYFHKLTIYEI